MAPRTRAGEVCKRKEKLGISVNWHFFACFSNKGPRFHFALGLANYVARHQVISPNTAGKVSLFPTGFLSLLAGGGG